MLMVVGTSIITVFRFILVYIVITCVEQGFVKVSTILYDFIVHREFYQLGNLSIEG